MGGSSGGFFYESNPKKPSELIEQIKREQELAKTREFENKVNELIKETLRNANNRDIDAINSHIDVLLNSLNKEIDGSVQTVFGGSVAKHTFVNGLSDVDLLVVLNKSELANKSPDQVNQYFKDQLSKRFPKSEVTMGKLAVTIKFSDGIEIQILPALKTSDGVKIAQENGRDWSNIIRPGKFAEKLVKTNQQCNGKVVPVVKLAKSIISSLPEKRQLSGYHIESLAVSIFANYKGENTTKAMLKYFFEKASTRSLQPIADKTGQSINTDSYLGKRNSIERKAVSDSLSGIQRRIETAERSQVLEKWKDILL